ncbi:MAG: hypothetical protein IT282_13560 [Bacteroidetes bacterium]|nr:hypothetical protein [Bacteroidota bacterium]
MRTTSTLLTIASLLLAGGCASVSEDATRSPKRVEVAIADRRQFDSFESLIPIPPDSVLTLYSQLSPEEFHQRYRPLVDFVTFLVDSFNTTVDNRHTIDTVFINHAVADFAEAGQAGRTLYISSSYFFLFNDTRILRSVLTHEFGHIRFRMLDSASALHMSALWERLRETALFYLFRDGEYSGNARFGGHPEENPAELYASAYNLVRNRPEELRVRFRYADSAHLPLLTQIFDLASR